MAAGPIGKSLENLANSLSDCHHFRLWQGNTWDKAEALSHIYRGGLPEPPLNQDSYTLEQLEALRPFVELYLGEEGGITLDLDAAPNYYNDTGVIVARFEQSVDREQCCDKASAEAVFDDFIDSVIRTNNELEPGLVELAARTDDSYLFFERVTIEPSVRTSPSQQPDLGDAQARFLVFEFGAV